MKTDGPPVGDGQTAALPPEQFRAFRAFARGRTGYARAVRTAAQTLEAAGWSDPLGRRESALAIHLGIFGGASWYEVSRRAQEARALGRDVYLDPAGVVWLNRWCAWALADFHAAQPAAAVDTDASKPAASPGTGSRRRRPKLDPLMVEMQKLPPGELADMRPNQMANRFKADPQTAKRARAEVLGKIGN